VAKKPELTVPTRWNIYRAAAKLRPLGTVEAADEHRPLRRPPRSSRSIASKLIAVQRR
jgi:hypothetical protein